MVNGSRTLPLTPSSFPSASWRQFIAILRFVLWVGCFHLDAETQPKLRPRPFQLTEKDRAYWAFQPLPLSKAPTVQSPTKNALNPVDTFILATLHMQRLRMNPPALPREQVRRLFLDLIGLPPSPEEVSTFERQPTDLSWAALVDRLLASPHYGERWGRHWLDLVRYAESNGYERDGPKPNAWRYRDYVIDSFNSDKPYDRFIREQIAGDEWVESNEADSSISLKERRDALIATGFYRLHVWDDEPDNTVAAEYDDLDDILSTTGTAFLGLTLGCARCHDHKFDPISQPDYYSLLSFIRNIDGYGLHHTGGGGRGTGRIMRPLASPLELKLWEENRRKRLTEATQRLDSTQDALVRKTIEDELKRIGESKAPFDMALAISESGGPLKPTFVLTRGEPHSPGIEVYPSVPAALGFPTPLVPIKAPSNISTGRRTALAAWIADARNPLTARVLVNRVWQHHFGTGLVPTPDDFGLTGLAPSNPELLDHLALNFVTGGWSLKRLHKLILTSRAYRMSSRPTQADALAVDPENRHLWRQSLRRVESEVIRDSILAISGSLNPKQGGPSVFPTLPKEVHATQDSSGKGWEESVASEQNRRSVYLVVKRALKIPLLDCLDFANSTSASGLRSTTTVAPQALTLLNDTFVQNQSSNFATRLRKEAGPQIENRIRRGFQLALQRPPNRAEQGRSLQLIKDQKKRADLEKKSDPDDIALQSFCRALLNLSELIYAD